MTATVVLYIRVPEELKQWLDKQVVRGAVQGKSPRVTIQSEVTRLIRAAMALPEGAVDRGEQLELLAEHNAALEDSRPQWMRDIAKSQRELREDDFRRDELKRKAPEVAAFLQRKPQAQAKTIAPKELVRPASKQSRVDPDRYTVIDPKSPIDMKRGKYDVVSFDGVKPGTLLSVWWGPSQPKSARFVRVAKLPGATRTATNVFVEIERVDPKGKPTGKFGKERAVDIADVLAIWGGVHG